ncbi:unnamed protein product, partial [Hymenolepis diminuta]
MLSIDTTILSRWTQLVNIIAYIYRGSSPLNVPDFLEENIRTNQEVDWQQLNSYTWEGDGPNKWYLVGLFISYLTFFTQILQSDKIVDPYISEFMELMRNEDEFFQNEQHIRIVQILGWLTFITYFIPMAVSKKWVDSDNLFKNAFLHFIPHANKMKEMESKSTNVNFRICLQPWL